MKSHAENGIFDFGRNFREYRKFESEIAQKAAAIRRRIDGCHTVGNGNFKRLENLRHKRRQAFTKILEGLGIIAVAAGAAATIIIASDGCGKTEQQDSSVLTDGGVWYYRDK